MSSSLSSAGRLSCLVVHPPHCHHWVDLVVRHPHRHRRVDLVVRHPCCHCCLRAVCPVGGSSSIPHVVVVVIHGPVVLWRPHPRHYLVGLIVRPPHRHHHRPRPLLPSLSSGGHVVHPPLLSSSSLSSGASSAVPHIIVISCPPRCCCCCCHPWFFSPAGASSPSLSLSVLATSLSSSRGLSLLICPC